MKLREKVGYILKETFNSPRKDSFVAEVEGKSVVLREGGVYEGINLEGADLRGARLNKINLRNANLTNVNLAGAQIRNAILDGAKLQGVVLSGTTDMTGVQLDINSLKGAVINVTPLGITPDAFKEK